MEDNIKFCRVESVPLGLQYLILTKNCFFSDKIKRTVLENYGSPGKGSFDFHTIAEFVPEVSLEANFGWKKSFY